MIEVYTDGGCRGNGKPDAIGAFAFVVVLDGQYQHEYAMGCKEVTNNIMELSGVIAALEYCAINHPHQPVKVYTDSKYVKMGITEWIHGWIKRHWLRWDDAAKCMLPVKNKALWENLHMLTERMNIYFEWVRGHNGNVFNERADELCNKAMNDLQNDRATV